MLQQRTVRQEAEFASELCTDADKFGEVSDNSAEMSDISGRVSDIMRQVADTSRNLSDMPTAADERGRPNHKHPPSEEQDGGRTYEGQLASGSSAGVSPGDTVSDDI